MKLPKLITTTPKGRRVYPLQLTVNGRNLKAIIIDPHYEVEHGSYMTDEIIYNFALRLNNKEVIIEDRKKPYEYFTY
jgi:hypothetical protein